MSNRRAGRRARRRPAAGACLLTALAGVAAPAAAPGAAHAAACTAGTGPYQRQLEAYLKRPVDGRQSPADCAAIAAFQRREGIRPADGYAGLATYRQMLVAQARPDPNAAGRCPVVAGRMACVDLDRQLMWVQQRRRVIFAPVPVRSGRAGQTTRTGSFKVYWKHKNHVSTLYANAPMPYSQFFSGGQALHGHPGNLFDGGGSAGCVNLTVADARRLWDVLQVGDGVRVWGRKPGT
ncbi:L,D-transpeptidase family protein [Streptomyces luteosporeus]|uniref:L,D-transpeptidase family protein n=1 Tax=Streptomyces luteosporeus TaxID=173856 RepID=A0ABP6G7A0_9ACTN